MGIDKINDLVFIAGANEKMENFILMEERVHKYCSFRNTLDEARKKCILK